jgi:predicted nucleic acid-binding protein
MCHHPARLHRLSSNRSYVGEAVTTPAGARHLLRQLIKDRHHSYLREVKAPAEIDEVSRIIGHQQLTDAYLVGLARLGGCKLVTFDRQLAALVARPQSVEVLLPRV